MLRHYTQSRPRPHRQKLNYRPSRPQVLCRRIREVSVKMESERKVCVCVFEGERRENGREGERRDGIGYRGERQGEGKDGGGVL